MSISSKRHGFIAAAGGLLLAACTAHSDGNPGHPLRGTAAQRVEIGAVGEPVISAVGAAAEADAVRGADLQEPEEVRLPDGTVGVKMAQRYFHTIVACRQKDGSFSTRCPAALESSP